jgi:hypothetical protein
MQSAITQELHGAASFTNMDISLEGDIAVVTGDCIRHLNWNDKNMDLIHSSNKVSSEVEIESAAPTLQSFHAPEVLCVKFSPATVSPNGRPLLAASTSLGEIYTLRAPQLGVASTWLLHSDLSNVVLEHLMAQPELDAILSVPAPPSSFILAHGDGSSNSGSSDLPTASENMQSSENIESLSHISENNEPTASLSRLTPLNSSSLPAFEPKSCIQTQSSAQDDANRKMETLEKLKRRLAEAEAASKYAAAMKVIDSKGNHDAQSAKDAAEAAAAAEQARMAVAAATEAAESALSLIKQLSSSAEVNPPVTIHAPVETPLAPPLPLNVSLTPAPAPSTANEEFTEADAAVEASGNKRVRSSDSHESAISTPRTPAYATKTPGYVSKFAMDSRVPGASDQLARIIKSMLKMFLAERAKRPANLQISYGSWNKFSEHDQNLMTTCFESIYAAEGDCIHTYQLADVCTTKRLQQHVRIALRKSSEEVEMAGDADEVEKNLLLESSQQASGVSGSFATPTSTHPAFAAGGRIGAGVGLQTPLPSLKKPYGSSTKVNDAKFADKSRSMGGGKKLPQSQMLAMQCRCM